MNDNLCSNLVCDTSGPHTCNTMEIALFIEIVVSIVLYFSLFIACKKSKKVYLFYYISAMF